MGKKAKLKRKTAYKAIMESFLKSREQFIDRKFRLLEKLLSNEELFQAKKSKDRRKLTVLERATLDMKEALSLNSLEMLEEKKEAMIEAQKKSAKFKYTPKRI